MKSKTIVFAALLVAAVMALFAPRQAQAGVTFSYFYESLLPYGDWVDVDHYGYCWAPRGVTPDWRPYIDGYWTYTDAGWTWVSYEDFGSITYHYGRWVRLEDVGWVWKPDYRWGPAWVSWRQSDRYMGWAPLPPDVAYNEDNGVGVWVDRDYDIGPSAYAFCETRYFGAPAIRNVIVPVQRNVDILDVTVNITNITYINTRDHGRLVYCGGPDYRWLAARSERPINRLELVLRTDGDWVRRGRPEFARNAGLQLFIDAPVIEPPHERFAPPHVAREIRAPRIDRGWGIVADPGMRERIHQRYQEQTRGLTAQSAPAYRVNENEVRSFVREARPAPGVVQTAGAQASAQPTPGSHQGPGAGQPQGVQPQQPGQPQQQVPPSAQPTPGSHRGPGAGQPQAVPPQQPAVQPQQQVPPSAQPTPGSHQGPGAGQPQGVQPQQPGQPQQQVPPSAQPTPGSHQGPGAGQPQAVPPQQPVQPQQQVPPSAQPTPGSHRGPGARHTPAAQPQQPVQPSAQPQATTAPQRVQPSAQAVQTPNAIATPAQQVSPGQRSGQAEQAQRNAVEQQQRQAAESARNQQQRQAEQAQRNAVEQQQRQAAESARNQQRQAEQAQRNAVEQQQRQAAESARNQQRQAEQAQRNAVEQQQRQAAESARNQQQRQAEQAQRNAVEQQRRQAVESARSQQRQAEQRPPQQVQRPPQQAAPQGQPNASRERDKDRKRPDRPNELNQ